MDTVLQLDKITGIYRKITVKKNRYPQGADECIVKMVSEENQAVTFEVVDYPPDDIQTSPHRLQDIVHSILKNKDTVTFDELLEPCKSSDNGLKNCLKKLEVKGYVSKASNSKFDRFLLNIPTWHEIC
jgi:hypothetical protein